MNVNAKIRFVKDKRRGLVVMYIEQPQYTITTRPAKSRGLCAAHYNAAFYHVQRKHSTWKQLEDEGKVLPSRCDGGRFSTWLKGRSAGRIS